MRLSTFLATTAGALVLTMAGAASAATIYNLQYSDAFGSGNFGTVAVSGGSTDLHFVLTLTPGYQLIDAGSHYAFAMNLGGSGFGLTGVTPQQFTLSTGALSSSPFGGFNLGLNCVACGPGGSAPWGSSLTFDITGTNLSVLAADTFNAHPIFFAADVLGPAAGATGVVGGGSFTTGVPEPSAWALMIAGFGGVGALIRTRRRAFAVA